MWPSSDWVERRIHSGHRLVEHEQSGSAISARAISSSLPLSAREGPGVLVAHVGQVEPVQQVVCSEPRCVASCGASSRGTERSEEPFARVGRRAPSFMFSITDSRRQRLRELERAHHATAARSRAARIPVERLAVEDQRPRVGVIEAGEQVEERGLAGAVRSDQRGDDTALDTRGDRRRRRAVRRRPGGSRRRRGSDPAWRLRVSQERRRASAGGQRASSNISSRDPKIPCGRKTMSSDQHRDP